MQKEDAVFRITCRHGADGKIQVETTPYHASIQRQVVELVKGGTLRKGPFAIECKPTRARTQEMRPRKGRIYPRSTFDAIRELAQQGARDMYKTMEKQAFSDAFAKLVVQTQSGPLTKVVIPVATTTIH